MSWNSEYVAALPPVPGDIFVVTSILGKRVALQPIGDYDKAVATARAFAGQTRHPIKVLSMSLRELLAFMGIPLADFVSGMSPAVEQELRQLAIDGCMAALRECNDPAVRADAHKVLVDLGVLKQ
jgi:hypothetical protein